MNTSHKHFSSFVQWYLDHPYLVILVVCVVSTAATVLVGNLKGGTGFPLDDAWIHQTYARNLALNGHWEYVPGETSAGSTSPLWTLLLSIGFLIGMKNPVIWSAILSTIFFYGMVVMFYKILCRMTGAASIGCLAGSLLLALEWHLLWSSGSGMETILYCSLVLSVFNLLLSGKKWLWMGLLAGLCVWVRPDGITLLGPVLLVLAWMLYKKETKFISVVEFLLPLIVLLVAYGWVNYSISGKVLPNTFYAKQLEYASVLNQPLWLRLVKIFLIPISGAGVFLIPGFIYSVKKAITAKNLWLAGAILWFLGYGLLYALRLPMTYQHGRYLFPLIPVFFVIGVYGSLELAQVVCAHEPRGKKLINLVVACSFCCAILFGIIGVKALVDDNRTINRLMVEPALWIKENTAESAVVAVHDIGAMGYFAEHQMIDLAGLINPEVIPFIRDQEKIKEYLIQEKADYLVVFSDWYDELSDFGKPIKTFEWSDGNRVETVEVRDIKLDK